MCSARHGKPECHFLYLAYRCYRELRLGGDNYRPRWTSHLHTNQEKLCRKLRERDMAELYETALGRPWREVLNPFVARTGFHLEDLPDFFAEPIWETNYGGMKWTKIAQHALDLRSAIDNASPTVENLVRGAYQLRHNDRTACLMTDGKGRRPGGSCCLER